MTHKIYLEDLEGFEFETILASSSSTTESKAKRLIMVCIPSSATTKVEYQVMVWPHRVETALPKTVHTSPDLRSAIEAYNDIQ